MACSAYGFTGATKGFLSCVPIAASVTATGRLMIAKTKALVEELVPGSRVVYGDSVAGYTPCIVRSQGFVHVTTFDRLAEEYGNGVWRPMDRPGKESCELFGVAVWSDDGWTHMDRVIRHRAGKPMVRIVTHTGVVDVTEDHSLLLWDGTPVSPWSVNCGERLMHADLSSIMDGLFPSIELAFQVPKELRTVIMRIEEGAQYGGIDCTSQLSAARVILFAESFGFMATIDTHGNIYRVTLTKDASRIDPLVAQEVVEMHTIEYDVDQYVYDVTTANHHFHAGVGRLVVHNTDSVMCILNVGEERRHDMRAHFEKAGWLADTISKTFPPPVELEFEKTYYPYLLFSKKRYAGLMFTTPDKPDYIDVKGLQLVRRDNCPLVKDVSTAILNKIMYERSVEAAVAEAKAAIVRVLQNSEALEKFIVSKALRSDYKNNAQPHVFVANKILRRTGMAVPSGARVPFVIVRDDANPKALIAERAEDPEHVRANGIKLDVQYYITHQLMSPITTLLELMVKDVRKEVLDEEPIKSLMRARENQENNQLEITSFFKRKRDTTG